jgi:peptidoglycan/LPS O-acetylase OafA/YrhL
LGGILLWLTIIWGVRRHKRWARTVASLVFVVATSIALLDLSVSEHGTQIFPTLWGILGILPCIAGLVAVILLWSNQNSGARYLP